MKKYVFGSFILIIVFIVGFTKAELISPSELLRYYSANTKVIEKHQIKSEEFVEYTNSLNPDKTLLDRFEYESIQNQQLRELTVKKQHDVKINEKGSVISSEESKTDVVIWDGQTRSQVSCGSFPTLVMLSKSDPEERRINDTVVAYGGACLDGFFWGDLQSIDVILKNASKIDVRSQMENVNGVECYVIDAITDNGKYAVWITPEHGYNIAKAEVHKSNNDKYFGAPLNYEVPIPEGMTFSKMQQAGKIKDVFFFLDSVNFREVNGVWIPDEAISRTITNYEDQETIYKKHYKRTQIDLDPDFKAIGAFIPDIPEGANVHLREAPGIRYIWEKGKLVPRIDEDALDQITRITDDFLSAKELKSVQISNDAHKGSIISPKPQENVDEIKTKSVKKTHLRKICTVSFLIIVVVGYYVYRYIRRERIK